MRVATAAFALWAATGAASALEGVVADLSQNRVSITADFVGSEILIFGAVTRDAPVAPSTLGVIVTVKGPDQQVTVRRKSRVAGIWANTAAVEIDRAPSFYAVASSRPVSEVLLQIEDLRYTITPRRAIRSVGAPQDVLDSPEFTDALIRVRENAGLYQIREGTVNIARETLFSTSVELPANLVEGNYDVRIFLTRDRRVTTTYHTAIFVQKVGLERLLYTLAHEQPLLYGILALTLAVGAGWGASAIFRLIRS